MYGVILSSPSRRGALRRAIGVGLAIMLCTGTVTVTGVWAATLCVDDDATGSSNATTATQAPADVPGDWWAQVQEDLRDRSMT